MSERRRQLIYTVRAGLRGTKTHRAVGRLLLEAIAEELEGAEAEAKALKDALDAANREIAQLHKENFWLSKEDTMGIYDQREVHRDCTVEILKNSVTGTVSVGWWPNECPPAGLEATEK